MVRSESQDLLSTLVIYICIHGVTRILNSCFSKRFLDLRSSGKSGKCITYVCFHKSKNA